jgi:multidrug efflux pump subunit AcrA (membrane-fusion protein)
MKKAAFAFLAITLVIFSSMVLATEAADPPKDQGPSVLVQLTKLEKGSLPRIVTAFGRVETNPSAQQRIQAPLSAVVDAVYVKPGQEVAEGAPLIRLAPSPAHRQPAGSASGDEAAARGRTKGRIRRAIIP